MSFYVDKVNQKKGSRYRIVRDISRNGKRKRTYFSLPLGTTKAQAEKIRCQMELEYEYGEYVQKEEVSFGEYVEEIYFPKYTQYLSVTTFDHYKRMYYNKNGLKENLGDYLLKEISVEVLQNLVNDFAKCKSPKTIRNNISFISVVLKQAMTDNYLKRKDANPCTFVRLPKLEQKEGNAYTMEEVKTMLERARESGNRNMELLVALSCLAGGLRRSELIGLKWTDISLEESGAYIYVRRAAVQTKEGIFEKDTKTKAGNRMIPIAVNGTVYNILKRHRKEYLKRKLAAEEFRGDDHVFIDWEETNEPLSPNQLYRRFKKFQKKECPDLPQYRLHDLRHTFFTLCSNIEGFSELSLIGTGGHSTILSSRRYQHPMMQKMLTDMEKLEETIDHTPPADGTFGKKSNDFR